MQRRDREINQIQQDNGKGQFPFPIFWVPYKPGEMEKKEKEVDNVSPEQSKDSIKLPNNGDNFKVNGAHTNGNASSRTKDIPLKQVEQRSEKESPGNHKVKEIHTFVKDSTNKGDKKCPDENAKKKSPSPLKASKFPLVCLRVYPFVRRKNTNGSSRSPSPPNEN